MTGIIDLDPDVQTADTKRGQAFMPPPEVLANVPALSAPPGEPMPEEYDPMVETTFYVRWEGAGGLLVWLLAEYDPTTGWGFGYFAAPPSQVDVADHAPTPGEQVAPSAPTLPHGWGHFCLLDIATMEIHGAAVDRETGSVAEVVEGGGLVRRVERFTPITFRAIIEEHGGEF